MAFPPNTGLALNPLGIDAPPQVSLNGQLQRASEIVSRFSDSLAGQYTRTSDQISHTVHILVPESTCQATGNVDDPVHDIADDGPTDDGHIDDGSADDGCADDGSAYDGSADDGSTDDGSSDISRCSAVAQFGDQDNDDLANDSLAGKQLAVTRTWSWGKGDDKEPLSTNLAGQASSSERPSWYVLRAEKFVRLRLSLPILQKLAKEAHYYTYISAEVPIPPTARNRDSFSTDLGNRENQGAAPKTRDFLNSAEQVASLMQPISRPPVVDATTTISNPSIPMIMFSADVYSRVTGVHSQPGVSGAPTVDGQANVTQKPSYDEPLENDHEHTVDGPAWFVRAWNDYQNAKPKTSHDGPMENDYKSTANEPASFLLIWNAYENTMQEPSYDGLMENDHVNLLEGSTYDALSLNGYQNTMHTQEPTGDVPTGNVHESFMEEPTCDALTSDYHENTLQEPTCDVPTEDGYESAMEEPTCDVPTGNGHESAMEEPTRDISGSNGRVMTAEEVTWDEGRIPSTSSKWSCGFMRKASDGGGMYAPIKEADSNDEVQDRQDSASSCSVRGCGIIDSLLHMPWKWFQPPQPKVPQPVSNVHDGSSSHSNQSRAHQGRSTASPLRPLMPDINRDGYVTFPTLSPPTPSSPLVSQSSEHQKSTSVHHARRGTTKGSKFSRHSSRLITVDKILQYPSEVPSMQRRRAIFRTPMRRTRSEGRADPTLAGRLVLHRTSEDLDSPEMNREFDDVD